MVKWWRENPIRIVVLVLVAVVVGQMIYTGEVVTMDFVQIVVLLLGGETARASVYSKATVEDWLPEEFREG